MVNANETITLVIHSPLSPIIRKLPHHCTGGARWYGYQQDMVKKEYLVLALSRLSSGRSHKTYRIVHQIINDLRDLSGKPGYAPWLVAHTNLVAVERRQKWFCFRLLLWICNLKGLITWSLSPMILALYGTNQTIHSGTVYWPWQSNPITAEAMNSSGAASRLLLYGRTWMAILDVRSSNHRWSFEDRQGKPDYTVRYDVLAVQTDLTTAERN